MVRGIVRVAGNVIHWGKLAGPLVCTLKDLIEMALQIQIHIRLPKPIGATYSKDFLDAVAKRWLEGDKLPKAIKVDAIEWRDGAKPWVKEARPRHIERARENFSRIPFRQISVSPVG